MKITRDTRMAGTNYTVLRNYGRRTKLERRAYQLALERGVLATFNGHSLKSTTVYVCVPSSILKEAEADFNAYRLAS